MNPVMSVGEYDVRESFDDKHKTSRRSMAYEEKEKKGDSR